MPNARHKHYNTWFAGASMTGDCETHSDCDYFHCKGRCDLIEGKCSGDGVVNDNLQAICDNVFLGKTGLENRMENVDSGLNENEMFILHCP